MFTSWMYVKGLSLQDNKRILVFHPDPFQLGVVLSVQFSTLDALTPNYHFQIDKDGSEAIAAPERKIVHAQIHD